MMNTHSFVVGNPLVGIADGRPIAWTPDDGGCFRGDAELVAGAEDAVKENKSAQLHPLGESFQADASTMLGAAAAMECASPGRMMIVAAPESYWNALPTAEVFDIPFSGQETLFDL